MKTRELIRRISENLNQPTGETAPMLRAAILSIKEALGEGKSVHLGQLGRLEASEDKPGVRFWPKKMLLTSLFGKKKTRGTN